MRAPRCPQHTHACTHALTRARAHTHTLLAGTAVSMAPAAIASLCRLSSPPQMHLVALGMYNRWHTGRAEAQHITPARLPSLSATRPRRETDCVKRLVEKMAASTDQLGASLRAFKSDRIHHLEIHTPRSTRQGRSHAVTFARDSSRLQRVCCSAPRSSIHVLLGMIYLQLLMLTGSGRALALVLHTQGARRPHRRLHHPALSGARHLRHLDGVSGLHRLQGAIWSPAQPRSSADHRVI